MNWWKSWDFCLLLCKRQSNWEHLLKCSFQIHKAHLLSKEETEESSFLFVKLFNYFTWHLFVCFNFLFRESLSTCITNRQSMFKGLDWNSSCTNNTKQITWKSLLQCAKKKKLSVKSQVLARKLLCRYIIKNFTVYICTAIIC